MPTSLVWPDNQGGEVMLTRRQLLKAGAITGATLLLPGGLRPTGILPSAVLAAAIPGGTLDPTTVDKYVTPLVIPPAMPRTASIQNNSIDYYVLAVRQFLQQILPPGQPATTVWSYGSHQAGGTFNYPAFTIEATVDRPVRVKWVNELVDGSGNYLPHLLPVDPTLHWANPPGGPGGRDRRPTFTSTPGAYTGPVPMVVHLHGGHSTEESDVFTEAWDLPAAQNIPAGLLPGPAPQLGDPPGTKYYEIPIAVQDRSFNSDGSLFYPTSREFFDGFAGPYIGADSSDISPIWNPEFFGNMT